MCVCVCITSITKGEVDCCWPTYLQGQSAVWRQQWLSLFFTSDEIKLLFTTNKQGWREGRKQRTPTHTHMQTHTWEIKAVSDCCSLETRRQPKTVKKKSVKFLNVAVNRVFITENGHRVCVWESLCLQGKLCKCDLVFLSYLFLYWTFDRS